MSAHAVDIIDARDRTAEEPRRLRGSSATARSAVPPVQTTIPSQHAPLERTRFSTDVRLDRTPHQGRHGAQPTPPAGTQSSTSPFSRKSRPKISARASSVSHCKTRPPSTRCSLRCTSSFILCLDKRASLKILFRLSDGKHTIPHRTSPLHPSYRCSISFMLPMRYPCKSIVMRIHSGAVPQQQPPRSRSSRSRSCGRTRCVRSLHESAHASAEIPHPEGTVPPDRPCSAFAR